MVDAEESDSEESDEYLAFEFFFDLTAQYHAPRIKMEYDDPSLDNFEEKLGEERSPKPFFEKTRALLDYKNNSFNLFVDWSMIGDERYDPPKASPRYR